MANLLQRARQNRQSAVQSLVKQDVENIFDIDFKAKTGDPRQELPEFLRRNTRTERPPLSVFYLDPESRVAA